MGKLTDKELAECCNTTISALVEAAEEQISTHAMEVGILLTRDAHALLRSLLVMGFERGAAYGEAHSALGYSATEALIAGARRRTSDVVQSPDDARKSKICILELLMDLERSLKA